MATDLSLLSDRAFYPPNCPRWLHDTWNHSRLRGCHRADDLLRRSRFLQTSSHSEPREARHRRPAHGIAGRGVSSDAVDRIWVGPKGHDRWIHWLVFDLSGSDEDRGDVVDHLLERFGGSFRSERIYRWHGRGLGGFRGGPFSSRRPTRPFGFCLCRHGRRLRWYCARADRNFGHGLGNDRRLRIDCTIDARHGYRLCRPKNSRLVLSLSSDRKSTRLNSSHQIISYAVFCLKKKKQK